MILLAQPAENVRIEADARGVFIRGETGPLPSLAELRQRKPRTSLGWVLPDILGVLIEKGLAEEANGSYRITHSDFLNLEEEGIADFATIAPGAPFVLQVQSTGSVGMSHFKPNYQFFRGTSPVPLERLGAFVRFRDEVFILDRDTFNIVEEVDRFNALEPGDKEERKGFESLAMIRDGAMASGIDLSPLLRGERIVVAPKIGVSVDDEPESRITFVPTIDGVPNDKLREEFLALELDHIDEVLSIANDDGTRVRVVLDDEGREVLRRMQRVRHVGGKERSRVLRDPQAVFDGVNEKVVLDGFSERVIGIGDFPFASRSHLRAGLFDEESSSGGYRDAQPSEIECQYADGSTVQIPVANHEEFLHLYNAVETAWQSDQTLASFKGRQIPLDATFVKSLREAADRMRQRRTSVADRPEPAHVAGNYLLIHTNESDFEYAARGGTDAVVETALPNSLIADLKSHQLTGFHWLVRNFSAGKSGCLLADDMGLGKTLQVLTFLAWLIEHESDLQLRDRRCGGPHLIVSPLILLENATWINDMRKFFQNDGAIFGTTLVLRDAELKRLRVSRDRETVIGEPVLDLETIARHRIVFTNYETVTNYQHSFARIPWCVLVTDEAQEYKTPSTKISHALKSLKADFRIASTGTPVETRLLDIWNLFDFLQPGLLLSAKEFTSTYEDTIAAVNHSEVGPILEPLKTSLGLNLANGFVMRRDKRQLTDLPEKQELKISCDLSDRQREIHKSVVIALRNRSEHPFAALHRLVKIYQHPALLSPDFLPPAAELVNDCPKLLAVVRQLETIRDRGEKCLIFTVSVAMQQILASTIRHYFGIEVGIVNGASPRKGDTKGGQASRKAMISRFEGTPGFSALVLSPDVAGIGLTIVEANHVIHYGRWWNPAKEMQATDRVYRIGQRKPVTVYYPVAIDPLHEFESFDEKLDKLLRRRKDLAADFLEPMASEDTLGEELVGDLERSSFVEVRTPTPLTASDIERLTWDRFEALIASVEKKARGGEIVLTPKAGDGGADVISINRSTVDLIQCKHSRKGVPCDEDAVRETIAAVDFYRSRVRAGRITEIRPRLVTSGTFTKRARKFAREHDVELLDGAGLCLSVARHSITLLDIAHWSDRRAGSLAEVFARIERT